MNEAKEALRQELDTLRTQIASLQSTVEEKPEYGLGKGAPAVAQWELNRALLQRLKEQATSIERMLSSEAKYEYGVCKICGKSIHPDRLAVLPNTRVCIHCARAGEHR
jgi:RNA polymerase-binding transcription factor DksA